LENVNPARTSHKTGQEPTPSPRVLHRKLAQQHPSPVLALPFPCHGAPGAHSGISGRKEGNSEGQPPTATQASHGPTMQMAPKVTFPTLRSVIQTHHFYFQEGSVTNPRTSVKQANP